MRKPDVSLGRLQRKVSIWGSEVWRCRQAGSAVAEPPALEFRSDGTAELKGWASQARL